MKEMIRYGFILAMICVVASGLLAGMNSLTKAKILAQAQTEEETTLKELVPEAAHFEPVKSKEGEVIYYKAHNKEEKLVGVVFKAGGKGYSSTIETMVGMTGEGKILGIKVVNQNETPGLGSQVTESAFSSQFSNKNISALNEVQAITGATISSKAVIDSVTKRAQQIKELIKDEK